MYLLAEWGIRVFFCASVLFSHYYFCRTVLFHLTNGVLIFQSNGNIRILSAQLFFLLNWLQSPSLLSENWKGKIVNWLIRVLGAVLNASLIPPVLCHANFKLIAPSTSAWHLLWTAPYMEGMAPVWKIERRMKILCMCNT